MAGRKKIDDNLKSKTVSINFTENEKIKINEMGEGKTFSQKVKNLIFGDDKMELQDIYNQGFQIGKFYGLDIRTVMLQITSESTRDFRVQKLLEMGINASLSVPDFLVSYLKKDSGEDVEKKYYMFLMGINNGMLEKK